MSERNEALRSRARSLPRTVRSAHHVRYRTVVVCSDGPPRTSAGRSLPSTLGAFAATRFRIPDRHRKARNV
jgi:hypothetical protein